MKLAIAALLAAVAAGLFTLTAAVDRAAIPIPIVIDEGDAIIDPTLWIRET